jgi:hypothetical protein
MHQNLFISVCPSSSQALRCETPVKQNSLPLNKTATTIAHFGLFWSIPVKDTTSNQDQRLFGLFDLLSEPRDPV